MTNNCNLACDYCYVAQSRETMTKETAKQAVNLARASKDASCGIIFFGGEPLFCRDLIYETVYKCREAEKEAPTRFHFKMTTNGTLLDREFLQFSKKEQVLIALSHDGTRKAHDFHRKNHGGEGTYDSLEQILQQLLSVRPYAPVMMTICPETVGEYAKGVRQLWDRGFHYFICSLNYAGDWDTAAIKELKRQYQDLAGFYYELTCKEEKFYFSPFEVKMSSYINGKEYCHERCELGRKQISVSPDGRLFPCTQFVGDDSYCIGYVSTGIDQKLRRKLYLENEWEKPECSGCVVKSRCNCHCGCLNYQVTGSISHVPPMLCEHERIVLPVADRLAEKLFKKKNGMFIQKHYNDIFPLISMVEDLKR